MFMNVYDNEMQTFVKLVKSLLEIVGIFFIQRNEILPVTQVFFFGSEEIQNHILLIHATNYAFNKITVDDHKMKTNIPWTIIRVGFIHSQSLICNNLFIYSNFFFRNRNV